MWIQELILTIFVGSDSCILSWEKKKEKKKTKLDLSLIKALFWILHKTIPAEVDRCHFRDATEP